MTELNTLLKHTSRSLYLSARLLPGPVRPAFCTAYLLCRYADSIADTSLLPTARRLHWIQTFPQFILQPDPQAQQQLVQEIIPSAANTYEEQLLRHFDTCRDAYARLAPVQQTLLIDVVHAVCRGMEMDLQIFPSETSGQVKALPTASELETYCHLMGGAPGVFWSRLIAGTVQLPVPEADFLALGRAIGDALQIVNILRDLPRDVRIGRCYFPADELQACGLDAQDLLDPANSARFEPVKQKWIAWGRQKLGAAAAYLAALPKTQLRHRAAVAWPVLWAADTLRKLEAEKDLLQPQRRVKIARARIYGTMLATPGLWLSDRLFIRWLRAKGL